MIEEVKKTTGTFNSYDGTEIYFESRGSGETIVLAYGIACLMNHWNHQIREFSKKYRVISFDYRGHHQSATPVNHDHLKIDSIVEDINCLLKHLRIKEAHFFGHSFGVPVLIRLFDLYPQTIKTLVFVNGFAQNPVSGMLGKDLTHLGFEALSDAHKLLPQTLGHVWKIAIDNPISIQLASLAGGFNLKYTSLKDVEVYAKGVASLDLKVFLSLFKSMIDFDGTSSLERINVPTLILGGDKDGVTPVRYQVEMHKLIKGSELQIVANGSHCTQLDLPDSINLRIEKFLAANQHRIQSTSNDHLTND